MGRIKTKLIKRLTLQLMKEYSAEFKNDFAENKALVAQHLSGGASKKMRNSVAGYVTRLKGKSQE